MKFLLLIMLLCPTLCYAASQDYRIVDNEGDVLDITSDGKLTFGTNDNTNMYPSNGAVAPDVRISDNDGEVLNINSDGSVDGS